MNNLTASEVRERINERKSPLSRKDLFKIQMNLFNALVEHYINSGNSQFPYYFELETEFKFLANVLEEISLRGFKIEVRTIPYGLSQASVEYYPLGSIYCTYGDFNGYRFSF